MDSTLSFPTNTRKRKRNTPRSQPRMAGNSGKIRWADCRPDLYGGPYSLMVNGQEWSRFENAETALKGASALFLKNHTLVYSFRCGRPNRTLVVNTELSTGSPHSMR